MRAWENVGYGLPRAGRRERALELLDRFGIGRLADARATELSGGERQRVALARALAPQPKALLLDEPLSALDARTRTNAARELAGVLRDASVPALLVTHDFEDAALLADEVAVIDQGRVVQRGAPGDLVAAPASAFVADFTGAAVLTGTATPNGDLTSVQLDGGAVIASTEEASGRVAVSVHPTEVVLEPLGPPGAGSARNRVAGRIVSMTALGNRMRVGMETPQPLAADVTGASAAQLGLKPGDEIVATWKAAATRLLPL